MKKRSLVIILFLVITLLGIICGISVSKSAKSNDCEKDNLILANDILINTDEEFENIVYEIEDEKIIEDKDVIGILEISKIGLEGPIKEGSASEVLRNYIGHIENTSWKNGNIGLAAHNRGNTYSYFARINELNIGDEIRLKTNDMEKIYKVCLKEVIEETNWKYLENTNDNRVTLITCIKDKPNLRLCVQAKEI